VGVRVGIDTGGTFTDLVAVDTESGRSTVSKVPSNPGDPVAAVAAALTAAELGPANVVSVVVGTTIGINAVLTRTGARVVYLTTSGFEDIPFIQRINRKYHYDFTWRKPMPLVERPDCIGVAERLDEEGGVEEELDVDALAA
jgi:N-methylhydantoinase A